jgi:epoxyqueuosine reductase
MNFYLPVLSLNKFKTIRYKYKQNQEIISLIHHKPKNIRREVMNSQDVKQWAKSIGADLVGIASAEHFEHLPAANNPRSIYPDYKSVIVLGKRILRGSLRGIEEGTNFKSTYECFGFIWLEDNFLSKTTYDMTCRIEENNFEAVPLFGYQDLDMSYGMPVADGKPAPNVIVDSNYAAHAAGLAEYGLGDIMLTEKFGTRQRFAIILTDAELEPDMPKSRELCNECGACVTGCPLGAINPENLTAKGVPGFEMPVAEVNMDKCMSCDNGAMSGGGRGKHRDRLGAACTRSCLVQLEKESKLKNSFVNKFRKRTPWARDKDGNPVADYAEQVTAGKRK